MEVRDIEWKLETESGSERSSVEVRDREWKLETESGS